MKIDHLSGAVRPAVQSFNPVEAIALAPQQTTRSKIAALAIGGLALVLTVVGGGCGGVVVDSNDHGGAGGAETTTTNSGGQSGTGGEPISEVCVPQIIESPSPEYNGYFGIVIAYNPHAKILAVEEETSEKVFIYSNTDQGFQHIQTLSFADSVKITAGTMAINDQFLVIGETGLSSGVPGVMIYEYQNNEWLYQTTFEMPGSISTGIAPRPALEGTRLVVGIPIFDTQGVAFEFSYDAASKTWNQGETFNSNLPEGEFGMQVALQDNITVIGDDSANVDGFDNVGQVYVFQDYSLKQAINPDANYFDTNPGMGNVFALNNGVLVVGSPNENVGDSNTNTKGAAYVYTQALDGTFPFKQKLFGSDNFDSGKFGQDVAVNENGVIIVKDTALQELHVFATKTKKTWENALVIPYDGGVKWSTPNALAVDRQRIITGLRNYNTTQGVVRIDCLPAELQ